MPQDIAIVRNALASPQHVAILSHRNPDGDAIGSSLALRRYLETKGHTVSVVLPSDWPPVYALLSGVHDILVLDREREAAMQAVRDAGVIFLLDLNTIDRVDDLGTVVTASAAPVFLIDHHLDPEPFPDWMLSDPSASSTAELIYVFIGMLGDHESLTKEIAEALFTGIITDTGSFRFSTTPGVFRICAHLKELGVDDYRLQNLIFNSLTEKQLRLIGHCIANRMELLHDYRTGIMHLTQEDFREFGIGRGDTEGIVNYILMLRSMRIAIFVTDQTNIIKLSFRSKGQISVQQLAQEHFNGGGHKNAAGGSSKKPLEEVLRTLREILPEYLTKQGYFQTSA